MRGNSMIYVFSFTIVYTLIKQKDKLLKQKRNMVLYLLLSVVGVGLGVVYLINPYLPSISLLLEKHMK
jgi:hypothetical protein